MTTNGKFFALLIDGYKADHRRQYPGIFDEDGSWLKSRVTKVQSNYTPRNSRIDGQTFAVAVGLQMFLTEWLGKAADEFFAADIDEICEHFERRMLGYLGPNDIGSQHLRDLHALGYIPLEFKAWPEGSKVPLNMPMVLIENTHPDFFWLVNYFETLLSSVIWGPIQSATTAWRFRQILERWADATGSPQEFVGFQGHDFSFRGMWGPEPAARSGVGHLLFFDGTDTLPAIDLIEECYGPLRPDYMIGVSVTATEHAVMCAGSKESELETYRRLLQLYPEGILSVVSDTWDLWKVCTEILPALKDLILSRNGKLVIRPDSGDPVKIVCGDPDAVPGTPEFKGVIELLHETFGGTETETGHILLDSHIGCIYGDGISEDRMERILQGLADKGFASANMVFGLGSYTYTYVTRDTLGQAMKATYAVVDGEPNDLFKDPITDDGGKRSAKGRLAVVEGVDLIGGGPAWHLVQSATPDDEARSILQPVWRDSEFLIHEDYETIRNRARA